MKTCIDRQFHVRNVWLGLFAFMGVFVAKADTVAWWSMAYPIGACTTVDTVVENRANPGSLDAKPISMTGATIIEGSDYCPQGAEGLASGWGVWNPQSGESVAATNALYFHKVSVGGNAGALRVSDPERRLQMQTFTFEAIFRMQSGTAQGDWNCLAVMPGKLFTTAGSKVLNYDS